MAKSELGGKHTCKDCGIKFYDLNRENIACPECGLAIILENALQNKEFIEEDKKIQKETPNEEVIEENNDLEPLSEKLTDGIIAEEDNPIIMDDEDLTSEDSDEELIDETGIDIPEIESEELMVDDDDFLVEEDDIEEPDLIIKNKSEDE